MDSLELFFFGYPHILRGGQPVALPRRKLMALLAYLVVTGKPQPRTALALLFWPESSQGLASLRRHLSELKSVVGADALAQASGALVALAGHEEPRNPRLAWHLIQYVLAAGTASPEVLKEVEKLQTWLEDQNRAAFGLATRSVQAALAALIEALKDSHEQPS